MITVNIPDSEDRLERSGNANSCQAGKHHLFYYSLSLCVHLH